MAYFLVRGIKSKFSSINIYEIVVRSYVAKLTLFSVLRQNYKIIHLIP